MISYGCYRNVRCWLTIVIILTVVLSYFSTLFLPDIYYDFTYPSTYTLWRPTREFTVTPPFPIPNPETNKLSKTPSTIYSKARNITSPKQCEWHKYRLGDMFKSHKFREREDGWELHHREFNTSLAVEYMRRTDKDADCLTMIQIINQRIRRNKTLRSLMPDDQTLVIHLRTGDVIDRNEIPIREYLSFDGAGATLSESGALRYYTRGMYSILMTLLTSDHSLFALSRFTILW